MNGRKTIVGLGELLWDLLPAGERLGGAPANFTVMTARLGNRGVVASRLGADMRGDLARGVLNNFLVDLTFLQTAPRGDLDQHTGTVGVEIAGGEPRYVIHAPAAWDFLEWTAKWRALATECDAVCFGTLAQRERPSRDTIGRFLRSTRMECVRVFDVNLRAPFFSPEVIAESLQLATIFKLNRDEVSTVLQMLRAPAKTATVRAETDLPRAAGWLMARYPMQMVAITLGSEGSLLVTRDAVHRHPGVATKVVDTVGAGDAFTAALVDSYLRGATLAAMGEAANRWGARVASQPGAMLDLDAAARADVSARL